MADISIKATVDLVEVNLGDLRAQLEKLRVSLDLSPVTDQLKGIREILTKPLQVTLVTDTGKVRADIEKAITAKPIEVAVKPTALPAPSARAAVPTSPLAASRSASASEEKSAELIKQLNIGVLTVKEQIKQKLLQEASIQSRILAEKALEKDLDLRAVTDAGKLAAERTQALLQIVSERKELEKILSIRKAITQSTERVTRGQTGSAQAAINKAQKELGAIQDPNEKVRLRAAITSAQERVNAEKNIVLKGRQDFEKSVIDAGKRTAATQAGLQRKNSELESNINISFAQRVERARVSFAKQTAAEQKRLDAEVAQGRINFENRLRAARENTAREAQAVLRRQVAQASRERPRVEGFVQPTGPERGFRILAEEADVLKRAQDQIRVGLKAIQVGNKDAAQQAAEYAKQVVHGLDPSERRNKLAADLAILEAKVTRQKERQRVEDERARGRVPSQDLLKRAELPPTKVEAAIFDVQKLENLRRQRQLLLGSSEQTTKAVGGLGNSALVASTALGGPLARALGIAGQGAKTFGLAIAFAGVRIAAFAVAIRVVFGLQQAIGQTVRSIIKFESQLASTNKIFNLSNKQLIEFGRGQIELARNFGRTVEEVQEIGTEFARQGLTVQQTLSATEGALLLVNAAGVTTSQAMELLTITVNTFGKSFSDASQIADIFVAAADATASSVGDLIEILKRSASTGEDLGFSLESIVAAGAVLRETTRRNATALGTSLKSITTFLVANEDKLNDLGVALTDQTGKTRAFEDVLLDLNKATKDLTDVERARVAAQLIEKRQINAFIPLVKRAARVQEILAIETAGFGSAQRKAGIEIETTARKIDTLGASFFGLIEQIARIGPLDVFKGIVDFANIAISAVGGVVKALSVIPGLAPGILTVFAAFGTKIIAKGIIDAVAGAKAYFAVMKESAVVNKDILSVNQKLARGIERQIELLERKLGIERASADVATRNLSGVIRSTSALNVPAIRPGAGVAESAEAAAKKVPLAFGSAFGLVKQQVTKLGSFIKSNLGGIGPIIGGQIVSGVGDKVDEANEKITTTGNLLRGLGEGLKLGGFAAILGVSPQLAIAIGAISAAVSFIRGEAARIPSLDEQLGKTRGFIGDRLKELGAIKDLEESIVRGQSLSIEERQRAARELVDANTENSFLANKLIRDELDLTDITEKKVALTRQINEALTKQTQLNDALLTGLRTDLSDISGFEDIFAVGFTDPAVFLAGSRTAIAEIKREILDLGSSFAESIGVIDKSTEQLFKNAAAATTEITPEIRGVFTELREAFEEVGGAKTFDERQEALERFAKIQNSVNQGLQQQIKSEIAVKESTGETVNLEEIKSKHIKKATDNLLEELRLNKLIHGSSDIQIGLESKRLNQAQLFQKLLDFGILPSTAKYIAQQIESIKFQGELAAHAKELSDAINKSVDSSERLARALSDIASEAALIDIANQLNLIGRKRDISIINFDEVEKTLDAFAEIDKAERDRVVLEQNIAAITKSINDDLADSEFKSKNLNDIGRVTKKELEVILGIRGKLLSLGDADKKIFEDTLQNVNKRADEEDKLRQKGLQNLEIQRKLALEVEKSLESTRKKIELNAINRSIEKEILNSEFELNNIRREESQLGDVFSNESLRLANERLAKELEILDTKRKQSEQKIKVDEKDALDSLSNIVAETRDLADRIAINIPVNIKTTFVSKVLEKDLSNFAISSAEAFGLLLSGVGADFKDLERDAFVLKETLGVVFDFGTAEILRAKIDILVARIKTGSLEVKDFRGELDKIAKGSELEKKGKKLDSVFEIAKKKLDTIKNALQTLESGEIKGIEIRFSLEELQRLGVTLGQDQVRLAREEANIRIAAAEKAKQAAKDSGLGQGAIEEAERNLARVRLESTTKVLDAQIAAAKTQVQAAQQAGSTWLNFTREQRVAFVRNVAVAQALFSGVKTAEEASRRAAEILKTGERGRELLRRAVEGLQTVAGRGSTIGGGIATEVVVAAINTAANGQIATTEENLKEIRTLDIERNKLLRELISTIDPKNLSAEVGKVGQITPINVQPLDFKKIGDQVAADTLAETLKKFAAFDAAREKGVIPTPAFTKELLDSFKRPQEEANKLASETNNKLEDLKKGFGDLLLRKDQPLSFDIEKLPTVFGEQIKNSVELLRSGIQESMDKGATIIRDKVREAIQGDLPPLQLDRDTLDAVKNFGKEIEGKFTVILPDAQERTFNVRLDSTELVANLTTALQELVSKEELDRILEAIDKAFGGRLRLAGVTRETR